MSNNENKSNAILDTENTEDLANKNNHKDNDAMRDAESITNAKVHVARKVPKQTIQTCLQKLLRVTLTDGRTIEGMLECYDNHANMVLSDATDISNKGTRPFGRTIRLGMVLIPGRAAEKVLAWREKYKDTGEVVHRVQPTRPGDGDNGAVGEDSDDEFVIAEGFDGMHVG